jgi:hypothetical protein
VHAPVFAQARGRPNDGAVLTGRLDCRYGGDVTDATSPEPTLTDVMAALAALTESVSGLADGQQAIIGRIDGLEDRMIDRFEAVRAELALIKADSAVEQAYGRDTAEAIRRHIHDPNAHRRAA